MLPPSAVISRALLFKGSCTLAPNEEDVMSSTPKPKQHLTSIRGMVRRVVDDGGYPPNASMDGKRVLLVAASLLMKLCWTGITSPAQLESALREQLREVMPPRQPKVSALPRYAVQGLPQV